MNGKWTELDRDGVNFGIRHHLRRAPAPQKRLQSALT